MCILVLVFIIVISTTGNVHDGRIITNRVHVCTHNFEARIYGVYPRIYVCVRQFTKECVSLKMTLAMCVYFLFTSYSFFINKGITTRLRQLPRYISYAQSALFFKLCAYKIFYCNGFLLLCSVHSSPPKAGK